MSNRSTPDYQKMFERTLEAISQVTLELLTVESECNLALEDAGLRESSFTPELEQRLDTFVRKLHFPSELKEDADYRLMYLQLCNSITYALEQLGYGNFERAEEILRESQLQAEGIFIRPKERKSHHQN